jgi:hypothetical protein
VVCDYVNAFSTATHTTQPNWTSQSNIFVYKFICLSCTVVLPTSIKRTLSTVAKQHNFEFAACVLSFWMSTHDSSASKTYLNRAAKEFRVAVSL